MTLDEFHICCDASGGIGKSATFHLKYGVNMDLPRGCVIMTKDGVVNVYADMFELQINPSLIERISFDLTPPPGLHGASSSLRK